MDAFAVLKVLFVFLSGPLCSALFSTSFFMQCCFMLLPSNSFPFQILTTLSCPSFHFLCFLSFSLSLVSISHPGSLCFSLHPLSYALIFHHSLSTLSSAQSPLLLLFLFNVSSLPRCSALSADVPSLVAWNTADLSMQEPEIRVWCKRHLKVSDVFTCDSRLFTCLWRLDSHLNCHQRYLFNYCRSPWQIYSFNIP